MARWQISSKIPIVAIAATLFAVALAAQAADLFEGLFLRHDARQARPRNDAVTLEWWTERYEAIRKSNTDVCERLFTSDKAISALHKLAQENHFDATPTRVLTDKLLEYGHSYGEYLALWNSGKRDDAKNLFQTNNARWIPLPIWLNQSEVLIAPSGLIAGFEFQSFSLFNRAMENHGDTIYRDQNYSALSIVLRSAENTETIQNDLAFLEAVATLRKLTMLRYFALKLHEYSTSPRYGETDLLVDAIASMKELRHLDLEFCYVSERTAERLAEANLPHLETLIISRNFLQNEAALAVLQKRFGKIKNFKVTDSRPYRIVN